MNLPEGRRGQQCGQSSAVLAALVIDALIGDPPNRFHPVAWMGNLIQAARKRAPGGNPGRQLAYGGLVSLLGMTAMVSLGWLFSRFTRALPRPINWLFEGALLKMMLSMNGLKRAAREIQLSLEAKDLPEARRLVRWHLVSRDTSTLDESQVAAAAIESVAENTSDGVVAPLFYYALFGLPGALAYRWANTMDAMWGYRDTAHEWLGKIPARMDDLLNLVPARLTALLLIISAFITGDSASGAWRGWKEDHSRTESPNAGHPMGTAAGALGVQLTKKDHYSLGHHNRLPAASDIQRATRMMTVSVLLAGALCALLWTQSQRNVKR